MARGGGYGQLKKTWIRHWACITLIIHADVCTCLSGLAGEAWILVLPGARDNRKVHVPLPARATSTWLIADRRLQHSAELRPARPRPHGLQVVLGRRGGIGTDLATRRFRVRFVDLLLYSSFSDIPRAFRIKTCDKSLIIFFFKVTLISKVWEIFIVCDCCFYVM